MSAQIKWIQISSSSFHHFIKLYVLHVCVLFYTAFHFFGCLPWFLHPVIEQCIILLAAVHCPSLTHARTMSVFAVLFCQLRSFFGTVSFFIRLHLVTRNNLLSNAISATRILRSSFFLRHQHSEPYNTIGTTKVSNNFTLVVFETFFKVK